MKGKDQEEEKNEGRDEVVEKKREGEMRKS